MTHKFQPGTYTTRVVHLGNDMCGWCYSFYDHFDIHWDNGNTSLNVADLGYIGVRKWEVGDE